MDTFVALLDAVGDQKHEIQETDEGDYRFLVMARRSVVAEAVARMIAAIDYGSSSTPSISTSASSPVTCCG